MPNCEPQCGPRPVVECIACGEEMPINECPKSQRPCGHHCNHSWSHDSCCWCGEEFGQQSQ